MRRLRWQAMMIAALAAVFVIVSPIVAHAQTLTAVWDPNPPADQITNYQVCIGTSSLSCNFQLATVPATENSYSFTPNAGVLYYIAVRANNSAGSSSYSPEVTTSIPALSQPANQTSTVNVAIGPLGLTATDPDGGSLQFSHTGLPFGLSLSQTTGIITGTPTSAGTFNVTVFVTDGLATTSRTFTWTVQNGGASDTTAPALSITSHTNGQTVSTASISLAGTASDSGSGGSGITSVTVNGSAATGGAASGNNTASWSRSVNLSSGANVLTVVATDGAGNARTSQITINRTAADTTAPNLAITSHTTGQSVTTSSITLAGTASDSGTGGSGITSVTVNGSAATGGTATGSNTANWSRSVSLSTGANVLTVVATDGAGMTRSTQITVNRGSADTSAPSISITSHTSNQSVNTSTITLRGTASDSGVGGSGIASVTVNGTAASGGTASGNGTANWNLNVTLSAGANTLTVVATDGAGNARTTPITVRLDSTAPALAITSHTSGQTVTTSSIMLAGTATDSGRGDSGIGSVLVNGSSASGGTASGANTSNWSRSVTLALGPNTLTIEARDSAGNSTTLQITVNYAIAGVTSVSLVSNPASPQLLGTEDIAFTATGVGGAAPRQYKFLVQQGSGATQVAQNWSTTASFTWTPSAVGTYTVTVWARSAGVTADVASASAQTSYTIYLPSALALTSLTSNLATPQAPGAAVTFTANITGGSAPYSTKWWLFDGVTWVLVRNWAAGNTYTWTPTTANANYRVGVWVRDATTTADVSSMTTWVPYVITGGATPPPTPPPPTPPPTPPPATTPLALAGLTTNLATPQAPGTAVTFTASISGGSAPYSTKWWLFDGATWRIVRDWAAGTNYTWTPTTASANYRIGVWVRDATTTADVSSVATSIPYVISGTPPPTPPPPPPGTSPTIVGLTSNLASPQAVGTTMTFTAAASGGAAPYSYKWWLFNGTSWTLARDWSTNASYSVTPTVANPNYRITVWARDAATTADVSNVTQSISFAIGAPTPPPSGGAMTGVSVNANVTSPRPRNTTVTFTATGAGGSGQYEFLYMIQSAGGSLALAQDYSSMRTFSWRPTAAGTYAILVWARSVDSTDEYEVTTQTTFVVTP